MPVAGGVGGRVTLIRFDEFCGLGGLLADLGASDGLELSLRLGTTGLLAPDGGSKGLGGKFELEAAGGGTEVADAGDGGGFSIVGSSELSGRSMLARLPEDTLGLGSSGVAVPGGVCTPLDLSVGTSIAGGGGADMRRMPLLSPFDALSDTRRRPEFSPSDAVSDRRRSPLFSPSDEVSGSACSSLSSFPPSSPSRVTGSSVE